MAAKRKRSGAGGAPWAVALPVLHALFDLVARASCRQCGGQVILHFCTNCKKPSWPQRGQASA